MCIVGQMSSSECSSHDVSPAERHPIRDGLVERLARTPVLLVACDFDGTLSRIVPRPEDARPLPGAKEAIDALAALPHTHVAVISGRPRELLAQWLGETRGVTLVGSHGAEFENGVHLTGAQTAAIAMVDEYFCRLAGQIPGAQVERKPSGVALHYRRCSPEDGERARFAALAAPGEGLKQREGKAVVEYGVPDGDKGAALSTLRYRCGATGAVFIGDDVTDEDAFAVLMPSDLGIKIGEGVTLASSRIGSVDDVLPLLGVLARERERFLAERAIEPIERLGMLADQRTIALVTPGASLNWLCIPRIDSPAMLASLLDGPAAGSFDIHPAGGGASISQAYVGDTFTLCTRFATFQVTDYLDCSGGRPYQRAGRSDLVRVIEGSGRIRIRFAPRMDFGRQNSTLIAEKDGLIVDGHPDPMALYAPGIEWTIAEAGPHHTAVAEYDLAPGVPLVLELRCGSASLRPASMPEPARRQQTERFWSGWAETLELPPVARELVKRSALTIKALCYGPTGAIAAAGTTSLPEHLGGVRNWDYRYCWPRDASMAAGALVRLGATGHALRLLDWITGVLDTLDSPERMRPIYTVSGSHLGPEAEITELSGYAESRPVRISNAAATQVQLDVFGPIADLVALLAEAGAPVSPEHQRLVRSMATAAHLRWTEPDHGIWEIRGPKRHHTHSKVMCWMTIDRALRVEEATLGRRRPEWIALCEEIRQDILTSAWSERAGAFTIAYGSDELDAAALWVGLSGMLAPDDPKFHATIDAVQRVLLRDSMVYRYLEDDGLPGREGGFHICTGWLVESLVIAGRRSEAQQLFDAWTALAGPLGLMPEQYEPQYGISLGNFPQAYSHLAVIDAAIRLSRR